MFLPIIIYDRCCYIYVIVVIIVCSVHFAYGVSCDTDWHVQERALNVHKAAAGAAPAVSASYRAPLARRLASRNAQPDTGPLCSPWRFKKSLLKTFDIRRKLAHPSAFVRFIRIVKGRQEGWNYS